MFIPDWLWQTWVGAATIAAAQWAWKNRQTAIERSAAALEILNGILASVTLHYLHTDPTPEPEHSPELEELCEVLRTFTLKNNGAQAWSALASKFGAEAYDFSGIKKAMQSKPTFNFAGRYEPYSFVMPRFHVKSVWSDIADVMRNNPELRNNSPILRMSDAIANSQVRFETPMTRAFSCLRDSGFRLESPKSEMYRQMGEALAHARRTGSAPAIQPVGPSAMFQRPKLGYSFAEVASGLTSYNRNS